MSLDTKALIDSMTGAAKGVFKDKWPKIQEYAESEIKMFAERFATIAKLRAAGTISEKRARSHVEFQKEAWETVLLSIEGLNQLMVEEALNAALDAVKDVVNTAVGFVLLG
jgi:hypothetical protein